MKLKSDGETPESYDFWCAMWVLSSMLGRGVHINRPNAPVYMNWYTILVADSGITRKSSAVNFAHKVLRDAKNESTRIMSNRSSAEGLDMVLIDQTIAYGKSYLAIVISELVRFMGREVHTRNIPGLLTDLYDCPDTRHNVTINRGTCDARNVYVTFLSASTPAWLQTAINPNVVEGGFTSRVLFILENHRKRRVAWSKVAPSEQDYEMMMFQLRGCVDRAQKVGQISLSRGAMRKYVNWYQHKPESLTPFLSSFESREDSHALRLAACLAISEDLVEIQTIHMTDAMKIIKYIKHSSAQLFEGGLKPDDQTLGVNALIETLMIAGAKGIKRTELTAKLRNYLSSEEITHILKIMHELGMVNEYKLHLQTRGRRPVVWMATAKLADEAHRLTLNSKVLS